jgi:demethylmenaquinone methyltransferase/2-methoxy-6-polyprenyl-1,4-benzoquinol methylase
LFEEKRETYKIFNKIYKKYEFVNSIISFNGVSRIRREIIKLIRENISEREVMVDAGGGTGIMAILLDNLFDIKINVDLSSEMLELGGSKSISPSIFFLKADVTEMPIKDRSVNLVLSTFVARNVLLVNMMTEANRIIKDKGYILLCDFILPQPRIFRALYLIYMTHIMPLIAFVLSGKYAEYRYLAHSIKNWMTYEELEERITAATRYGTVKVIVKKKIIGGVVAIYLMRRES